MDGKISLSETHHKITAIEHRLKERYGARTHVVIHSEPVK